MTTDHRDRGSTAVDPAVGALRERLDEAVAEWRMLDRVRTLGVGIRGPGSLALLRALHDDASPVKLVPLHVDQHPTPERAAELARIVEECCGLTLEVIYAGRRRQPPCRACVAKWLRPLTERCHELSVDALVLADNLRDAYAALNLNALHHETVGLGQLDPLTQHAHPRLTILRPLLLVDEADVMAAAPTTDLPRSGLCDEHAERLPVEAFVADMLAPHPAYVSSVAMALEGLIEAHGRRARR